MKNSIYCILVLALCIGYIHTCSANAATEVSTEVVNYDKLIVLVISSNPAYEREMQEINLLEHTYSDMADEYRALQDYMGELGFGSTPFDYLKAAANLKQSLELTYDRIIEMKAELERKAIRHTYPAQVLFINHYTLLIKKDIAERELEILHRELANCRLKEMLGFASIRQVRDAERNVDNQQKAIKVSMEEIENNLVELAKQLGLLSISIPDEIPEMDMEKIVNRNEEADLAAYIEASAAVAAKALEDAEYSYRINNTAANRYMRDVAKQDYERAKKEAESDFPRVYDALQEKYKEYIESKAVSDAQDDYDTIIAQHALGIVSQSMLLDSELILENAKAFHLLQRIGLWLSFLEYEHGLA